MSLKRAGQIRGIRVKFSLPTGKFGIGKGVL
jgi:hypothetical protein